MSSHRCSAIVSVGPSAVDLWRGLALIESLLRWEPELAWYVAVDDAPAPRGLSELPMFAGRCEVMTLLAPRSERRGRTAGAACVGVLEALGWVHDNTDSEFTLVVRTDILVIAPFSRSIRSFLKRTQTAGLAGTVGRSSNVNVRAMPEDDEPRLLRSYRLLPPAGVGADAEAEPPLDIDGVGRVSVTKRRAFDKIRHHISAAIANDYGRNHYCQPAAYAVSRQMTDRLSAHGWLSHPDLWLDLPFFEADVMAMYAHAVGLQVCDYSGPGEVFALQERGLPHSPEELVARGHSIIGSVSTDYRYGETDLRARFNGARSVGPRQGARPASIPPFAAIVPIAPTDADVARARDLVDAVLVWEPEIAHFVLLEDLARPSSLESYIASRSECRVIRFDNVRDDRPGWWVTGVTSGILTALSWLQSSTNVSFALRIDTDALVVGPFAEALHAFLGQTPDAGLVGVIHGSCNPAVRALYDPDLEPWLVTLRRRLPAAPPSGVDGEPSFRLGDRCWFTAKSLRAFEAVSTHVDAALGNGYTSMHCQGGACVVGRRMMDRMAAAGYLQDPSVWLDILSADDAVLSMYAYAVGLRTKDFSGRGEPFGVQYWALPYSLEEIVARGHSIIHSVKNDLRYSEAEIRDFFRTRRSHGR